VATLAVGCGGGGSDALRVSLDDVDPSGGYWTIRAMCNGGHLQVVFRPGEKLSVPVLGHASSEEIAVECGKPERGAVSDEELRRHTPTAADLAEPTFEPTRLSSVADGSLVVEAHPVWLQNAIAGGGFRVRRGGDTIVRGAIAREEEFECGALAVEVDHVVERERGGRDDAENLRSLCESRHAERHGRKVAGDGRVDRQPLG
jgi:hypothetical protein